MTIHNFRRCIFERKTIMKLELKHLAPYLPYGLKILNGWGDIKTLNYTHLDDEGNGFIKHVKPFLRPMSDLLTIYKGSATFIDVIEFECNGYQIGKIVSNLNPDSLPYEVVKKLIEYHFDVFGLIPAGLAIDINTVD